MPTLDAALLDNTLACRGKSDHAPERSGARGRRGLPAALGAAAEDDPPGWTHGSRGAATQGRADGPGRAHGGARGHHGVLARDRWRGVGRHGQNDLQAHSAPDPALAGRRVLRGAGNVQHIPEPGRFRGGRSVSRAHAEADRRGGVRHVPRQDVDGSAAKVGQRRGDRLPHPVGPRRRADPSPDRQGDFAPGERVPRGSHADRSDRGAPGGRGVADPVGAADPLGRS